MAERTGYEQVGPGMWRRTEDAGTLIREKADEARQAMIDEAAQVDATDEEIIAANVPPGDSNEGDSNEGGGAFTGATGGEA